MNDFVLLSLMLIFSLVGVISSCAVLALTQPKTPLYDPMAEDEKRRLEAA